MMTFATALENWMQRMCYNAPAAAKALDVTAPTIRNWLGGRPNPHARAFMALMDKLENDK